MCSRHDNLYPTGTSSVPLTCIYHIHFAPYCWRIVCIHLIILPWSVTDNHVILYRVTCVSYDISSSFSHHDMTSLSYCRGTVVIGKGNNISS